MVTVWHKLSVPQLLLTIKQAVYVPAAGYTCVGLATVVEGEPSPNVQYHEVVFTEALLVKFTVLSLTLTKEKLAVGGTQVMITGLQKVSLPHTLVATKHTVNVPTVPNACVGLVAVDVLPSPKSHK